jgi:hypothetical protein
LNLKTNTENDSNIPRDKEIRRLLTLVWLHAYDLASQQIFIKLEKLIFGVWIYFKKSARRQAANL